MVVKTFKLSDTLLKPNLNNRTENNRLAGKHKKWHGIKEISHDNN